MTRPIRFAFTTAFAAIALILALVASGPATTQAAEPTDAPPDSHDHATWQQSTVSVWSNWNAAVCTGAYSNPTGDATPPLSPREMRGILSAVIAQLNEELAGGLTLVDAGAGPAGRHCGERDLVGGIFIGWSPLQNGIAGMAPFALDDGAFIGASVVINPILVCDNAKQWIEFVMLHELMHAIGLDHSEVPESVMYERAGCEAKAILHANDTAALNEHYAPVRKDSRVKVAATTARALGQVTVGVTDARVTPAQLIPRLAATGCQARTLAVTVGGRSSVYLVGAPAFVNAAFPASLPGGTTFLYRCAK